MTRLPQLITGMCAAFSFNRIGRSVSMFTGKYNTALTPSVMAVSSCEFWVTAFSSGSRMSQVSSVLLAKLLGLGQLAAGYGLLAVFTVTAIV